MQRSGRLPDFLSISKTKCNRYQGKILRFIRPTHNRLACKKFVVSNIDFLSETTLNGLPEGMRFIINNDGPYLIHCNEGKDRAGFVSALIECPILNCTAFYAISSADSFFRACFTLILLMQTIRSAPPTKPAAAEMAI